MTEFQNGISSFSRNFPTRCRVWHVRILHEVAWFGTKIWENWCVMGRWGSPDWFKQLLNTVQFTEVFILRKFAKSYFLIKLIYIIQFSAKIQVFLLTSAWPIPPPPVSNRQHFQTPLGCWRNMCSVYAPLLILNTISLLYLYMHYARLAFVVSIMSCDRWHIHCFNRWNIDKIFTHCMIVPNVLL